MFKLLWNYLLKPGVILWFLMQVMQTLFLFANRVFLKETSLEEITQCYTNSFSLDLASLAYLLILPFLALTGQVIFRTSFFIGPLARWYYTIVSLLIVAINWIDIKMFSYWDAKLSAKALSYLNTPEMVVASAGKGESLVFLLILVLVFVVLYVFFKKVIPSKHRLNKLSWTSPVYLLITLVFIVLSLRGGLREIPINQSDAYYSSNHILNVAGVNSIWNIGNVLFQNSNSLQSNPYKLVNEELAKAIFKTITHTPRDSTTFILNNPRPNIVYIALEGVNATCIDKYGGKHDFMPEVSKIMDEGYTFTQMYASGMRTDQGLVAVLSGFPALPLHTIGAQPEKFQHLPSLPLDLKAQGYHNKFFFAGEPEFGSFKAFLIHNGFEKVYGLEDYTQAQLSQDLGAPDEYLFEKFETDMKNAEEPFFSLILTQSTHEPFDMPFNEHVDDEAKKYINTVKYVDSLIGNWYTSCKALPWFENTLFIISSDHSHSLPDRFWYTDKRRFHIPFILFGPALKTAYQGKRNKQLVNQCDIPYSLAKQLNLPSDNYQFSKDMFNPYSPEYSSFIHIHGHNWITKNGECSINYEMDNHALCEKQELDSCLLKNASYFQVVFNTYMNY